MITQHSSMRNHGVVYEIGIAGPHGIACSVAVHCRRPMHGYATGCARNASAHDVSLSDVSLSIEALRTMDGTEALAAAIHERAIAVINRPRTELSCAALNTRGTVESRDWTASATQ